ncbi:hypothetical protein BCR44DRAFT_1440688 [Catenaria anguillulae PL171]|uniref:Uncharacterized protein n=1 Tax=Catenaria anguillulae PL171 TaxID=765915 RepID=A0A1Y2HDY8_9FUNG|nr:hypothetical protein BCR44DRAFT_1440688 [Catenaria anguillulae PL171]
MLITTSFDTTLIDLVYPKHLMTCDPNHPQPLYELDSINRVHIHFPVRKLDCAVIGISAVWRPDGDHSNISHVIHLLDGISLTPMSAISCDGSHMPSEFMAVDAVNKRVLKSMVRLLTFEAEVLEARLPMRLHIHDNDTYKLIFKQSGDPDLLVIQCLRATDLSSCRDDIKIRAYDTIHHYDRSSHPSSQPATNTAPSASGARKRVSKSSHSKSLTAHQSPFLALAPGSDRESCKFSPSPARVGRGKAVPRAAMHNIISARNKVPATIPLDHPLYRDFDEHLNTEMFGNERKGLTWFLDPEWNRPQCEPATGRRDACTRSGSFLRHAYPSCWASVHFHVALAGDFAVTDMVTENGRSVSGAMRWTAQDALEALLQLEGQVGTRDDDLALDEHCFPDGHVGSVYPCWI